MGSRIHFEREFDDKSRLIIIDNDTGCFTLAADWGREYSGPTTDAMKYAAAFAINDAFFVFGAQLARLRQALTDKNGNIKSWYTIDDVVKATSYPVNAYGWRMEPLWGKVNWDYSNLYRPYYMHNTVHSVTWCINIAFFDAYFWLPFKCAEDENFQIGLYDRETKDRLDYGWFYDPKEMRADPEVLISTFKETSRWYTGSFLDGMRKQDKTTKWVIQTYT